MNVLKNYFKLFIFTTLLAIITTLNVFANTPSNTPQEFISEGLMDIEFCNNVYVMASNSIYTSADGENWDMTFPNNTNGNYNTITVLNNDFIATGKNIQPIKSSDGIHWSPLRLDPSIPANEIHTIGKTYFWINSKNELLYSSNLLTWTNVPMPLGQKFLSANFVNDKCFFSAGTNPYRPNYFVLSENLTQKPLDNNINSIDDIYYLNQSETYIKIVVYTVNYSKKLQMLTSKDGVAWNKSELKLVIDNKALLKDQLNIVNVGGNLFLNIKDTAYMTSNALDWTPISNYGKFNNIKYSDKYFYGYSTSNDLLISKDGIVWDLYAVDYITPTSSIRLFGSNFFITNPNYDLTQNQYISKLYYSSIDSDFATKN